MNKVIFAVWNASAKEKEFLSKVEEFFISKLNDAVHTKIEDLKSLGSTDYGDSIKGVVVFGEIAANYCSFPTRIVAPSLKELMPDHEGFMKNKKILLDSLVQLAEELNQPSEEPTTAFIETKEEVSLGLTACDINITEAEAIHLKRIRDLLGGGKMVITKGKIRIEVEK